MLCDDNNCQNFKQDNTLSAHNKQSEKLVLTDLKLFLL